MIDSSCRARRLLRHTCVAMLLYTAGSTAMIQAAPAYAGSFYEPGGYEYGGWGRGYRVGPPRGGFGGERGGRSAPSIPHGARGGGGRR